MRKYTTICDVKSCESEAKAYTDVVMGERDEDGLRAVYYEVLDLCVEHEHEWRTGLPKLLLGEV